MKCFYLALIFLSLYKSGFAQKDSTIIYQNKEGKTTTADSAFLYGVFTKNGNLWHGKCFYASNKVLQSEGDYADPNFDKPIGTFKNYTDKGILDNEVRYNAESKKMEGTWYYSDGKKKAYMIVVDKDGQKKEIGWAPDGTEIKDYIVEKTPKFKGGDKDWKRYLEKNINADVAAMTGAPAGTYTVVIGFDVGKDGLVSNVKPISIPDKCKVCVQEAINVIESSPAWEPAIQLNRVVVYRQRQGISFVVDEGRKKRKSK